MGTDNFEIVELIAKDPERFIAMFMKCARECIANGAGSLVPGFGAIGSFLGQRGIHEVDGVPIIDIVAVVIKTAEMLVDLRSLGMKPSRVAMFNYATKAELMAARKTYGVD